ncbi:MAG: response regulator, partial [Clostridia bacterium]|nr:response regulator [Clostridia bacterium]
MPKNLDRFRGVSGKRQVLVVDDELINRELLRLMLENDFEVIFASNGVEAMEQIKTHIETLSLVLLDLLMPRMSGQEVLRALREDTEAQRLPVIVLTSDQEAEIECLALGAIDFISKPYPKPGVVLARVIRTIELFEDRDIIRSTERDPLTGLYNREFFYHFAEQFDQRHWGMDMDAIVVDVNHFHMINERHGKSYADGVLRRIGESLRE